MPRSLNVQQIYQQLMTTIIPDNTKYHDRWIINEEIADTIKDEEGNALGNYTNLNRITTSTWTCNHQGGHTVGDYVAITKSVRKKTAINTRKSMTFYYITISSNQITHLDSKCNLWSDVYNTYLRTKSQQTTINQQIHPSESITESICANPKQPALNRKRKI